MKRDKEGRPVLDDAQTGRRPGSNDAPQAGAGRPLPPPPPPRQRHGDAEKVDIVFRHELVISFDEAMVERLMRVFIAESRHLNKRMDQIMTKQTETAASIAELSSTLGSIGTEVDKIGVESTAMVQKIADLEAAIGNQGDTSPEVDAALQAAKDQAASLASRVKAVDDLVPDAPVGGAGTTA